MDKYNLIIVLGGPASGKGTLCESLTKNLNYLYHISAGDLIRSQNDLNIEFKNLMKNGFILPPEFVGNLIMSYIEKNIDTDKIILLDGFPRDENNYNYFCNKMSKNFNLIGILIIECNDDVMIERTINRNKSDNRIDDTIEICLKRIEQYNNETVKVINCFDNKLIKKISGKDNGYSEAIKFISELS
jgi:adenylate kinase family enzyme